MNVSKLLLLILLLTQQSLAQVDIINTGPKPTNGPIDAPPERDNIKVRPNQTKNNTQVNERFYDSQCGPAHLSYGCNFMNSEGVARMRDDAAKLSQQRLQSYKQDLAAEQSKVDKDLNALRAGKLPENSPAGLIIKNKLEKSQRLTTSNKTLNNSILELKKQARSEHEKIIGLSFGLAFKEHEVKDYNLFHKKIGKLVSSSYMQGRIQAEYERADAIEARIKTDGPKYQKERLSFTADGRQALDISKLNLGQGNIDRSQIALRLGQQLLDTALNFAPLAAVIFAPEAVVLGVAAAAVIFAKDYYESRTGYRLIGGEKLSQSDRALSIVGASLGMLGPIAALGKSLRTASETIEVLGDLIKGGRIEVEVAADAGAAVKQAENIVDSAKKLGLTNANETKLLAKALSSPKVNPFELAPTHTLTMSNREFSALKDSMQKDGMLRDTIKTVTHNGQKYIVDGHHRARAAKELGWKEVPVEEVTLPFLGYKNIDDLFN